MVEYKTMFDAYLVGTDGSVTNKNTGRILKQEKLKLGYRRVSLSTGGVVKRFAVHRLVAMLFLPNPENKPCVNHIDGDPTNNCLDNLEWATYSENEYHSYRVLGKQVPKGIDRWNARFTDEDIKSIVKHADEYGCRAAGRKFKCSHQYVSNLRRGLRRAA